MQMHMLYTCYCCEPMYAHTLQYKQCMAIHMVSVRGIEHAVIGLIVPDDANTDSMAITAINCNHSNPGDFNRYESQHKSVITVIVVTMMQVSGNVTYNGTGFHDFRPAHTAAYVDQNDLHQPELSVRETFDFAARCQGVGHKADELEALLQREKEQGITPDPVLDAFMRAEVRTGKKESIVTDLIIKMLGLDVSSDSWPALLCMHITCA